MSRFALWRLRRKCRKHAAEVTRGWQQQVYEILCSDQSIKP